VTPGAIIIEGHVQGLSNTRALGAAGIPVIVVDQGDCVARHSRYCTGFFRCPEYDSDALADFLIRLAERKGLKDWLLLPSNDHAVLTLSRNKARLEAVFKVITPGPAVIQSIYDKSRLLGKARSAGVPVPGTFYPENAAPEKVPLTFPVLTRGRFGLDFYKATKTKAFLARDLAELHDQLARIHAVFDINKAMTQELIPDDGTNPTLSYAAFCVEGRIKAWWMGEKVRQHPLRFGTATFAKSVDVPACHDLSVRLLNALNYTGVCEVEYLRDPRDGQHKLIEINARTWLWVGLARACGVDFARLAYDFVNCEEDQIRYPAGYDTGVCWVNPVTDVVYGAKAILSGHLNAAAYVKSIMRHKTINALFEDGDGKPGVAYLLNLFQFLKHR
jgi:predicted ATP-grasp superfamily ATP-dependent carboligase